MSKWRDEYEREEWRGVVLVVGWLWHMACMDGGDGGQSTVQI